MSSELIIIAEEDLSVISQEQIKKKIYLKDIKDFIVDYKQLVEILNKILNMKKGM